MARNDPTIYMRIPQSLKDALDAAALENKRSLTAEVVARLEESFAPTAASDAALSALALRLATTELMLAEEQMEVENAVINLHLVIGHLLQAISFNSSNGFPQPIDAEALEEVKQLDRETDIYIESVDEAELNKVAEKALAAIDKLHKLKAEIPPSPRFQKARKNARIKTSDH